MSERNRNELYKDGFVMRLPNRRITCQHVPGEGWLLQFERFHKPVTFPVPQDILDDFDLAIPRAGGLYTLKELYLSEEGAQMMVSGFMQYFAASGMVDFKTAVYEKQL